MTKGIAFCIPFINHAINTQGSAQEYLSGGLNYYGVCYIRVYFKWIGEKCKRVLVGFQRVMVGF